MSLTSNGLRANVWDLDQVFRLFLISEYFILSLFYFDSQMKREMSWKRQKAFSPREPQLSRFVKNV